MLELSAIVYGKDKALDDYRSLRSHLDKLWKENLIEIRNSGGKVIKYTGKGGKHGERRKVYLTSEGRICGKNIPAIANRQRVREDFEQMAPI